jgi:hypothetical protein
VSEKDGADFSATEGETEVTGGTGVDGVHGEAARFICGALQCISSEVHKL